MKLITRLLTMLAIRRVRRQFRSQCHNMLDAYLSDVDNQNGLMVIDTLVAYYGQGWSVAVGISLTEPEQTMDIEERAKASGIKIVKA